MLELEARAREQLGQLALAKCLRVGIEPPRIGAELAIRLDRAELAIRLDRAELGALEHKAIGTLVTVTDRAAVHVDRAPALGRARVDLMRTARRLEIAEPCRDAFDRRMIDRLRR